MNVVLKETIKLFIKVVALIIAAMWVAFVPVIMLSGHSLGLLAGVLTIIVMLGVVFWLIYQEEKGKHK